jgi:hypothetical protein
MTQLLFGPWSVFFLIHFMFSQLTDLFLSFSRVLIYCIWQWQTDSPYSLSKQDVRPLRRVMSMGRDTGDRSTRASSPQNNTSSLQYTSYDHPTLCDLIRTRANPCDTSDMRPMRSDTLRAPPMRLARPRASSYLSDPLFPRFGCLWVPFVCH